MQLKILRELFRAGVLKSAHVTPAPMVEDSWVIFFERIDGRQENLTTQRGEEKRYRGLPAAMEDIRRIGFKQVITVLPSDHIPIKR